MTGRAPIAVLGLGYVGLPLAVAAAEAGHRVVGYDIAGEHVARLSSGASPIADVDDVDLKEALVAGNLSFTADPGELAPLPQLHHLRAHPPDRQGPRPLDGPGRGRHGGRRPGTG